MSNIAELLPANNVQTGPKYGGVVDMTVDHWITIPDNPRQRDTEARAKRAKHLRNWHPTHSRVNMARLPDGTCYKLDGHTRAFLWAAGTLDQPSKIHADVWQCATISDAKAMYGTFDSADAVETTTDKVFGAIRENELTFESELLKSKRFANGMRFASDVIFGQLHARAMSLYELMDYWLPELRLLDACQPTRKRFHSGVMAAALLTLRRHGPEASSFWRNFAMGAGTKINGDRDAVQALDERMDYLRLHNKLSGRGNTVQIIRICLSAFEAHGRDHTYSRESSGIKSMGDNSYERWIAAAAKTKRRW